MRIAKLNFCDLGVNFLKDFVFFNGSSIIHLVLYSFQWECVWIVGDDEIFTVGAPLLSPLIPSSVPRVSFLQS